MAALCSSQSFENRIRVGDDSDVLHGKVDGGVVPVRVHGRAAILRHDHEVTLVGAGARCVLDRHVGPGAGIDDHVAAGRLEDGLQPRALPGAHPHFLDDEIAGARLEPRNPPRAPAPPDHHVASRPETGAAPQLPRTIALLSTSPSNSGALSVTPGAPGSTMNQTCMIATPRPRAASARRRTLSTTRCWRACAGAPESANAPPSMMTSFCRS